MVIWLEGLNLDRAYGWKEENTPDAVLDVEGIGEFTRSGDSFPSIPPIGLWLKVKLGHEVHGSK